MYKRNFDFIGISLSLFFIFSFYDFFKKRVGYRSRYRKLILLNNNLFSLLVILNITNLLTYIFSIGLEVKIIRSLEYAQAFLLIFLFRLKKLKHYKKYIPHASLAYLFIPPTSVMVDSSSVFFGQSHLLILSLNIFLISQRKFRIQLNHKLIFISLLFLIIITGSGISNGFGYNLFEFLTCNVIIFVSALVLTQSLQKDRNLIQFLKLFLLFFIFKILYIAIYSTDAATRGGVNNNLFGIAFEFLFFISFLLFLISRSKIEKGFFLFICFLLLFCFYKLVSRSPIISISYGICYVCLILFLNHTRMIKFKLVKYGLILFHFCSLSIIFSYLAFYSQMESILIRRKIWALGWRGIESDLKNFFFGLGDFGKVNLVQWLERDDFSGSDNAFEFDTGILQTHLHNDYLAFIYGAGFFFLLLSIISLFFILVQIIQGMDRKTVIVLGMLLVSFSIHGLTEPIITNTYTAFLFWFPFHLILFKFEEFPHPGKERNQVFKMIGQGFLTLILLLFLGFNFLHREVTQFVLHHPHLKMEVRALKSRDKKRDKEEQEILMRLAMEFKNRKYFYPFLTGMSENIADILLLDFTLSSRNDSITKSTEIYCSLFELQPIPRNFNNLRNIQNNFGMELGTLCNPKIAKQLARYDKFHFIAKDFY